uniref:YdhG-like domain-containing protein n=1 Tax=OCS116 cluster bacterium TaxID=2030921 RepID=A0A2A4YTQ5_9PROT
MADDVIKFTSMVAPRFGSTIQKLADIIAQHDAAAVRSIGKMMGNDALLYSQQDIMKYAITCHAKHISLHLMPIYCYADIHAKYKPLIKAGKFQKGCVNFTNLDKIPLGEIGQLIVECAAVPYPTQYQLDKRK